MKSNQSGGTMIEALLVISIVIVLSISGISLLNTLFTMFKQNMVSNELIEVQKNISARYRVYGYYDDIPTEMSVWKEEKLLPSQMILDDSIRHRLGGKVTIEPRLEYSGAPHYTYFSVKFEEIPRKTCLLLGQMNWTMSQSSDLIELKINETHKFLLPLRDSGVTKGANNALPAKTNVLMTACKEMNVMTWTFR